VEFAFARLAVEQAVPAAVLQAFVLRAAEQVGPGQLTADLAPQVSVARAERQAVPAEPRVGSEVADDSYAPVRAAGPVVELAADLAVLPVRRVARAVVPVVLRQPVAAREDAQPRVAVRAGQQAERRQPVVQVAQRLGEAAAEQDERQAVAAAPDELAASAAAAVADLARRAARALVRVGQDGSRFRKAAKLVR
jgi:hypothetical protein